MPDPTGKQRERCSGGFRWSP